MSDRKNFQQIVDRIDEVTGNAPLAVAAQMTPPAFGKPQATAIDAIVDDISQGISSHIEGLRKKLDEIEQQVLTGAARAKVSLHEQVSICVRVNDEINHMRDVIAELHRCAERATAA